MNLSHRPSKSKRLSLQSVQFNPSSNHRPEFLECRGSKLLQTISAKLNERYIQTLHDMISPFLFFTDWASGGVLHKLDADTGNHIVSNYKTRGKLMGIVAYDQSRQPPGMVPLQLNDQSR